MIRIKVSRAFTTIELVLTMTLTLVVMIFGIQMVSLSSNGLHFTSDESKLQSEARLFAEEVNTNIRYATAVFTIPQDSFVPSKLTPGWSYLGVMSNVTVPAGRSHTNSSFVASKALVHVKALGSGEQPGGDPREYNVLSYNGSKFVQKILGYSYKDAKNGKEIQYDLVFDKDNPSSSNQKIKYKLNTTLVTDGGKKSDYLSYSTDLEALNSLQVIHKGSETNPSVAIAYRKGSKELTVAHVSMVVDISGSMTTDMNGFGGAAIDTQRITIMKKRANEFIEKLSDSSAVDIGIFPFNNAVDLTIYNGKLESKNIFKSASIDKAVLKNRINSLQPRNATNTGDALRFGYYRLKEHNDNLTNGLKPVNYLIILVDGESNAASVYLNNGVYEFFTGDGIDYGVFGDKPNKPRGNQYVQLISNLYKTMNIETFFIVFSNDVGSSGVNAIKDGFDLNQEHIFRADNDSKLKAAFSSIQDKIKQDLWYLNGPEI